MSENQHLVFFEWFIIGCFAIFFLFVFVSGLYVESNYGCLCEDRGWEYVGNGPDMVYCRNYDKHVGIVEMLRFKDIEKC